MTCENYRLFGEYYFYIEEYEKAISYFDKLQFPRLPLIKGKQTDETSEKSIERKIGLNGVSGSEIAKFRLSNGRREQMGGFLGRKADGHPGVTVIWRGWQRLQDIAQTFELFKQNTS